MELREAMKAAGAGGDPYQAGAAVAAERLATEPSPPPAAPPAPPSVWSRVAGLFGRQREEARAKYLRLLRRVEVDGEALTDKQVGELAAAMKEAGISTDDVAGHRELLRRHRAATAAVEKLRSLAARISETQQSIAAIDRRIEAATKERVPFALALADAESDRHFALLAANNVDSLAEEVRALFGDGVT